MGFLNIPVLRVTTRTTTAHLISAYIIQGFGMIAERASARRGWRLALRGGRGGAEGPTGKQLQYDSNHADHHRLGISVL